MAPPPHLASALRRLRLQAAVARAEQSGTLAAGELEALVAQLAQARRDEQAARAAAGELALDVLVRRLGLRPVDEDVLLAAAALELDPLFATVASALAGEEPRPGVTPKLLAQITDDDAKATPS